MADHRHCKLGRIRPERIDPRIPRFSAYLKANLPAAPLSTNRRAAVTDWQVLGNDTVGNCVIASKLHDMQLWTAAAGKEARFTTEDAIRYYEQLCGYDPNDPSTDRGGIINDVLKWWLQNDICGHKIDAVAVLDAGNRASIRDAVWLCGIADIGVNLPLSAQTQNEWYAPPPGTPLTGDDEPGSWGGHDCSIVDYDQDYVYISTWGLIKQASWSWLASYCEEAYAILSKDWLAANGKAPNGFDYQTLVDDMKVLGPPETSLDHLQNLVDDPLLFEFKWNQLVVDIHEAAATYVLGLVASAFATYGYVSDSGVSTFFGMVIAVLAGFYHLAKIGHTNTGTRELVDVFAEIIEALQKHKH